MADELLQSTLNVWIDYSYFSIQRTSCKCSASPLNSWSKISMFVHQSFLTFYNNAFTPLLRLRLSKRECEKYHQEMGEDIFHFLCLHKLEGLSESACVLYRALLFNMHETHCLTAYYEFMKSQIRYPYWEKEFLAWWNVATLFISTSLF